VRASCELIDLIHFEDMLGHLTESVIVFVERLNLAHSNAPDRLLEFVAEPDLLSPLKVASDKRNPRAHSDVAAIPFECDESEAQTVEHQADHLDPLLIHFSISGSG
jgi:hypothetical protein